MRHSSVGPHVTVGEVGEHALIERLSSVSLPMPQSVLVGVGDDAAVLLPERGTVTVVTTDSLAEGIHFDRAYTTCADVGHKALAVNLSDLAAMGATPRHVLLSLALPDALPVRDFDDLLHDFLTLSTHYRATLVGGNITRSTGPLFVDVTVLGGVKRRRILTRGGARAGDELYVSGQLGGSAAGLGWLRSASPAQRASDDQASCRRRHLRPEPRVLLGRLLGQNRVTKSCIDLSDGLADGIHQLAAASRVGVVVEADALPIQPDALAWFQEQGTDPVAATLSAGEDYELLFTVTRAARKRLQSVRKLVRNLPLTRIGRITKNPALVLERDGKEEALPTGYQHFR